MLYLYFKKLDNMRTHTTIKTMKTVCGKELTYLETTGRANKMHSTTGPAVIYSESEGKAPEYYLFGIKYSKNDWKSLVNQNKAIPIAEAMAFGPEY
jgi:hypothetical protein